MKPDESLEEQIFGQALSKPSAVERAAYLDEACAGNSELRAEVEALLKAHEKAGDFLTPPIVDDPTLDEAELSEGPGAIIGRYRLVERIGEGGMGAVFRAEQQEPIRREVALKVIKLGMDTRAVVTRFDTERQSLALMDHPNIARVLDAGATDSGRPYFVMELVRGESITSYCDRRRLSVPERLQLFMRVCQAVQHAHQKGVIHRDLKPSNVLVTEQDGKPVPKVIDFGVAKAVRLGDVISPMLTNPPPAPPEEGSQLANPRQAPPEEGSRSADALGEFPSLEGSGVRSSPPVEGSGVGPQATFLPPQTTLTRFGQWLGTPTYMSPEQFSGSGHDVDTRSDIYSLGVLLYELLTGTTPLDSKRLETSTYEELHRIIREEDPPTPSTRLTQELVAADVRRLSSKSEVRDSKSEMQGASSRRLLQVKKTIPLLRGDLDWIVMKALEKDRARRFETASGLAMDLRRHLDSEPVTACPPSRTYRFRKMVRRNKGAFAATTAVFIALIAGVVGTTWMYLKASAARRQAQTDAAIAQAVNDFLNNDLLGRANTKNDPDRALTLRAVLDRAAEKIDGRFPDQPLVEAAIRETVGEAIDSYGDFKTGEHHLRRASELRRDALGPEHPQTLRTMRRVADMINSRGRHAEAEQLHRQRLEIERRVLGIENINTIASLNSLANAILDQGRYSEAEKRYRDLLELLPRVVGPEHRFSLTTMMNLANALGAQGRYAEAEELYRKVFEVQRRALGPEYFETLRSMNNLASTISLQGRYPEAEELSRKVLEIQRRVLGPEHHETLRSMNNLASTIERQGRYPEAEELGRKVLEVQQRVLGPEHFETLKSVLNLANAIAGQGRYAEAEELNRKALEIQRRVLGPEHPDTLGSMNNLANSMRRQTRYPDSERLFREVLEIMRRILGPEHPDTLLTMNNLAVVFYKQDKLAEVEALYRDVLATRRTLLGNEHLDVAHSLNELAAVLHEQGKLGEADPLYREALVMKRKLWSEAAQRGEITALNDIAWLLATCDDSALRDGHGAVDFAEKAVTATSRKDGTYLDTLAAAYAEAGQFAKAVQVQKEAIALLNDDQMKKDCAYRLSLYESGSPYRQCDYLAVDLRVRALLDQGNLSGVEVLHRDRLENLRARLPVDHPDLAGALADLTLTLLAREKFLEAEPLVRECLAIHEKKLPDSWERFGAESWLGASLLGQGQLLLASDREAAEKKFNEAEPLLLSGYEGMKARQVTSPVDVRRRLTETEDRLIQLYEAWDKPEQVEKWKRERVELDAVEKK